MRIRKLAARGCLVALGVSLLTPWVRTPLMRRLRLPAYGPVFSGTKSYRPVEPLSWDDVNRRVAPDVTRKRTPPASPGAGEPARPRPETKP